MRTNFQVFKVKFSQVFEVHRIKEEKKSVNPHTDAICWQKIPYKLCGKYVYIVRLNRIVITKDLYVITVVVTTVMSYFQY